MRELMPLTARPDIISFAGGLPAPELFPVEDYRDCLDTVLQREGRRALQYGAPFGPLKEALIELMRIRGVSVSADEIFITNGAQQGLSIAGQLLLNADSPVLIESMAFTGTIQMIRERAAMPLTLDTDLEGGLDVDGAEYLMKKVGQVRALIEVPDFHNPLGVSIACANRKRLVQLAYQHRVPIVEDDPYGLLRYEGEELPPLKALDVDGGVIYLGSFSKILAPGLRLGWVAASKPALAKLTVIKEAQDLESSQLTQRAVTEFISRGLMAAHLGRLKAAYRVRRQAMLSALEPALGPLGAKWSKPQGGVFVWVTLPESIDTLDLLPIAMEQEKIAFIPGLAFSVDGRSGRNAMRLNYSMATVEQIDAGIARLARVVRHQMGVHHQDAKTHRD
ncbi:MAG TPA: PLP-dependent aminotransferase family protein, partial [Anaerolineae bacterium]|nr:PLP-dependent aminotransferase family protein [Anaerolineae bacterium]